MNYVKRVKKKEKLLRVDHFILNIFINDHLLDVLCFGFGVCAVSIGVSIVGRVIGTGVDIVGGSTRVAVGVVCRVGDCVVAVVVSGRSARLHWYWKWCFHLGVSTKSNI